MTKERDERKMIARELSPWLKRAGPWMFFVVGLLVSSYLFVITPVSIVQMPLYALSLIGSAVLARLFLPIRQTIPKRRRGRGPLAGWGVLALVWITVATLGRLSDALLPIVYGMVGFPLAWTALLVWELLWKTKLLPCSKCATFKYFLRVKRNWFCSNCGSRYSPHRPPYTSAAEGWQPPKTKSEDRR